MAFPLQFRINRNYAKWIEYKSQLYVCLSKAEAEFQPYMNRSAPLGLCLNILRYSSTVALGGDTDRMQQSH